MSAPRRKIVAALARCVETLCVFSLCDCIGTISEAIKTCPEIWDIVDADTIKVLTEGCGFEKPTKEGGDGK